MIFEDGCMRKPLFLKAVTCETMVCTHGEHYSPTRLRLGFQSLQTPTYRGTVFDLTDLLPRA